MKKRLLLLEMVLLASFAIGCRPADEIPENGQTDIKVEQAQDDNTDTVDNKTSDDNTVQQELEKVEQDYKKYDDIDSGNMSQMEMNELAVEMFNFWDDELNSLWSQLSDTLSGEEKEKLLADQREWISLKEGCMAAVEVECGGGSIVPCLQYSWAENMTYARVYYLAQILADARGEQFLISPEVEKKIAENCPTLDDTFRKLQGKWIFDVDRGACIGIEESEDCDYAQEGTLWTVWVTGGDIWSDLDVYGYIDNLIVFKHEYEDYTSYFSIERYDDKIYSYYGTSIEDLIMRNDEIICE